MPSESMTTEEQVTVDELAVPEIEGSQLVFDYAPQMKPAVCPSATARVIM